MATTLLAGLGAIGAALIGRQFMRTGVKSGQEWSRGGFRAKMDTKEALSILGLKDAPSLRSKLKDAHRQIMIANHPDRGGSPYLASKVNEARGVLEKADGGARAR